MTLLLWSRWISRWWAGRGGKRPTNTWRSIRPMLERLEERLTPTMRSFDPVDTAGLISALQAASEGSPTDTTDINLHPGTTYTLTAVNNYWYGPDGLPPINSFVFIHGNGATIQRDPSAPAFRLFYVSGGMELSRGALTMDNVTLEGGLAKGGASQDGGGGMGAGGAIFNQGALNLTAVTLFNNEALGGASGVTATNSYAGGGMGGDASEGTAGGFGGSINPIVGIVYGGRGGDGGTDGGGGGGGFLTGADGQNASAGGGGNGGGIGGFGSGDFDGGYGGGNLVGSGIGGIGGDFGSGGGSGDGGGGGGVGGGGGAVNDRTKDNIGPGGGFGGGGGAGFVGPNGGGIGGAGGFGAGGGGGEGRDNTGGSGGFGGGEGALGFGAPGSGGGGAGMGGAIFNMGADSAHPSGAATLIDCTVAGNFAVGGDVSPNGGVSGSGFGGALFNLDGQLELDSDTVVGNHAQAGGASGLASAGKADGDAVYNLAFGNDIHTDSSVAATLLLNNSILSSIPSVHNLVSQAINGNSTNSATVSGSHNLVLSSSGTIAPGVITVTAIPTFAGPLQNNGGLTPTLLPSPGSPVLGAGDPSQAPAFDQRDQPRPPGGPIDLGAVQVSGVPTYSPSPSPSPSSPPPPSLLQAIFGLYIAEAEMDLHIGDPVAVQKTIDFDAQYTVIFGIDIAPLIEHLADANVQAVAGGDVL